MICILSAWTLEWRSVREWADADSKLRASINSLQDAWSFANVSAVIQLEAAVTRSIQNRDTNPEGPLGNYALAWESPEVRHKWALRTANTIGLVNSLLSILQETGQQYNLALNERLNSLSSEFHTIQKELSTKYSADSLARGIPVPDPILLRGRDAGTIDGRLSKLHQELLPALNTTVSELRDRASQRSLIYRLVFILGSILLVVGKFTDWRRERGPLKTS
jgi:hypothetical protein